MLFKIARVTAKKNLELSRIVSTLLANTNSQSCSSLVQKKIRGLCSAIQGSIYRQKRQQNEEARDKKADRQPGTVVQVSHPRHLGKLSGDLKFKASLGKLVRFMSQ